MQLESDAIDNCKDEYIFINILISVFTSLEEEQKKVVKKGYSKLMFIFFIFRETISDDSMKRGNWIPLSTDTAK